MDNSINIQQKKEEGEKIFYSKIQFNDLGINFFSHKVTIKGKKIILTNLEFNLLIYLASQPDRVFTYQQIYEAVWEEPYAYEKNNIMTHISHLRAKIEPDPSHPRYIENVRGRRYICAHICAADPDIWKRFSHACSRCGTSYRELCEV